MLTNFIYREIGKFIHIVNYVSGDILSFKKEDGRFLLDKLRLANDKNEIDPKWQSFVSHEKRSINSGIFKDNLIELGMEFKIPSVVNLELNRRCSLVCKHCYISRKELLSAKLSYFEKMDHADIERLFYSLAQLGVFLLVFTGGEIFLNKNIEIIYQQAKANNFIIEFFSNLQYLPQWFKQMKANNSYIGKIQTSVYSINPNTHDFITGTNGSFDATVGNITLLKKKGYYIEVATPLLNVNYKDRFEIEEFFKKVGIKHNFAWPILNEYYTNTKGKSKLNITKEDFVEFCQERPDFLIPIDFSKKNKPICPAAISLFGIAANGDVFPCSQYPKVIGNIENCDIYEIVSSKSMKQISEFKIGHIGDDSLPYNYCMGNNFSETGNEFMQPNFIKEILGFYHLHRKEVIENEKN